MSLLKPQIIEGIIERAFCQKFRQYALSHIASCEECQRSFMNIYDELPVFGMFISRKEYEKAVQDFIKKEAAHGKQADQG